MNENAIFRYEKGLPVNVLRSVGSPSGLRQACRSVVRGHPGRLVGAFGLVDDLRELGAHGRGQRHQLAVRVIAERGRRETGIVTREDHVVADVRRRVGGGPAGVAEPGTIGTVAALGLHQEIGALAVERIARLRAAARERERHRVVGDHTLGQDDRTLVVVELDACRGPAAAPVAGIGPQHVRGALLHVELLLGAVLALAEAGFAEGVQLAQGQGRGLAVGGGGHAGATGRKQLAHGIGVAIDGDGGLGLRERETRQDGDGESHQDGDGGLHGVRPFKAGW